MRYLDFSDWGWCQWSVVIAGAILVACALACESRRQYCERSINPVGDTACASLRDQMRLDYMLYQRDQRLTAGELQALERAQQPQ